MVEQPATAQTLVAGARTGTFAGPSSGSRDDPVEAGQQVAAEFLEEFAQMALELHEGSVSESVETVLEYALKAVDCGHAGVLFVHDGLQVETIAATDPLVPKIEALQVELADGPDVDVLNDRTSVLVTDARAETRWPKWGQAVTKAGVRSLLSVRISTSSNTIGMLNLYDAAPDKFDVPDQQVAHVLARHAAVALASIRTQDNLSQAIDSRKRIGQAQGILMERFALTEDQAFAVLRRYSQSNNIKLRTVAERLVSTRQLPDTLRPAVR
ncbi:MAG: ANTAR domain-containing protein [Marmoricola sp.]